jgi:hypothetical protein
LLGLRFLDLPNEVVEIRPFAGVEFGMERFAIGADFEGAAAGWNQRKRPDAIAEIENLSRQTDSFWGVVSNAAVLDPNFGFHRSLLSITRLTGWDRGSRCSRWLCEAREASVPTESVSRAPEGRVDSAIAR